MAKSSTEILNEYYEVFKSKNSDGSLRAFARLLNLSPGRLSQYLNAKRFLSESVAREILPTIEKSETKISKFIELVKDEKNQRNSLRKEKSGSSTKEESSWKQLTKDQSDLMLKWYFFPLLSLINTKSFRFDYEWIANALEISASEAEYAIQTLIKLEMLKVQGDKLVRQKKNFARNIDYSRADHRRYRQEYLKNMIERIDNYDNDDQDVTTLTVSMSKDKLPEAKQRIKKFREEMAEFLEDGERDYVYNLNIQLVNMQKK